MREIKFRAWNGMNMSIPDFIDENGVARYADKNSSDIYEAKHEIVMQYTGLKDKNGKEIYEGDIVWDGNDIQGIDSYSKVEYDEEFSGFIVYAPGLITPLHEALEDGNGKDATTLKDISGVYVVGNIYKNSNLLNND